MRIQLLSLAILLFSSCTTTKIIQSSSNGSNDNFIPLEIGIQNASKNFIKISNIIKQSKSDFVFLSIPRGEYYIDGTITNKNKRLLIQGQDKFHTKLIFVNQNQDAIVFTKSGSSYLYGSKIEDLTIVAKKSKTLIKIEKQRGFRIKSVNIVGGDNGVGVDFVYDFLMSDCYISQFSKVGLIFTSKYGTNTTTYIEHCHIEGSGDGIQVGGSSGFRINKTIIQSNKIGLVELDNVHSSTIFINDCHFEGNKYEAIYQKRSSKPGKSPSHLNIENTYLFQGGQTQSYSPVIFMDFGTLNMVNSSSSYKVGIHRSKASIGAEYAFDVVNNSIFENPIKEYFEYASKSKNQEFYKVNLSTTMISSEQEVHLTKNMRSRNSKSKVFIIKNNSIEIGRSLRPGIFEVSAYLPISSAKEKSKISCSIFVNNKSASPEYFSEYTGRKRKIDFKDFLKLNPKDKMSCKCKSSNGSFTIEQDGHILISRKSVY